MQQQSLWSHCDAWGRHRYLGPIWTQYRLTKNARNSPKLTVSPSSAHRETSRVLLWGARNTRPTFQFRWRGRHYPRTPVTPVVINTEPGPQQIARSCHRPWRPSIQTRPTHFLLEIRTEQKKQKFLFYSLRLWNSSVSDWGTQIEHRKRWRWYAIYTMNMGCSLS